jgi:hypothetical protein
LIPTPHQKVYSDAGNQVTVRSQMHAQDFQGKCVLSMTICVIVATLMQSLDSTIANVILPYMQGSMAASQDEINLVLMRGGWLTENYSWRWVFYVNVPFGILAAIGLLLGIIWKT